MENSFEKQNISFKKHTGIETKVNIISETPINRGSFGEIFDTVVEVGGHRKRFIIKKYRTQIFEKIAEKDTKHAFKNYSLAKEAGLKVFPTFRISEDQKSILMTTGFSDNQICVSTNNKINVVELGRPLIEEFEDLDKFISTIFAEGLKAMKKGISLHQDMFFFLLSKNEPTKVDFILGDLDNLKQAESIKVTGWQNMINIRKVLIFFCDKNIDPSFHEIFLDKVEYYYNQAVKKYE